MEELISIIIPVYKVEKYLDKCVQSVVSQTYRKLEIILVDDGSPDRCGEMCDAWAEKDKRIRVIHKENGGLSSARNAGIDASTGEYLMFIDSDDYIASEMAEKLYEALIENRADCAICGIVENSQPSSFQSDHPILLNKKEALTLLGKTDNAVIMVSMCNKLYNRVLFSDIRFPVGRIHEDQFTIHHVFYQCSKVVIIPHSFYYVTTNQDSITRKPKTIKRLDDIDAVYDRVLFYEKKGLTDLLPDTTKLILRRYLQLYFSIEDQSVEAKKRFRDARAKTRYTYFKYDPDKKSEDILSILCPEIYNLLVKYRIRDRIRHILRHK